ncbi:MAG TPA: tRNA (guanosine(37)-N1)-methyltransferase TrmD [Dehalococcoidia bacterium]|nr:tRNA (guanosine(37)-N1)-methyltransferase TrmD [Dehalococcoidia bacterium]
MRIDIFSLFPQMFTSPFSESIIKRAIDRELVNIFIHNIRDYTHNKHRTVDDYPYGGGAGMVLKPEPLFEAVSSATKENEQSDNPIILLTPQGRLFNHQIAQELSLKPNLILICGHYEGVDERVREYLATDEISIGEYILTGGELAAMVVVDAVVRLLPGVLGSEQATDEESYSDGLLEYPQYTRPRTYKGWEVPPVLLSGNHEEIANWRREQSITRTLERHPDLLEDATLSEEDRKTMKKVRQKGVPSS